MEGWVWGHWRERRGIAQPGLAGKVFPNSWQDALRVWVGEGTGQLRQARRGRDGVCETLAQACIAGLWGWERGPPRPHTSPPPTLFP